MDISKIERPLWGIFSVFLFIMIEYVLTSILFFFRFHFLPYWLLSILISLGLLVIAFLTFRIAILEVRKTFRRSMILVSISYFSFALFRVYEVITVWNLTSAGSTPKVGDVVIQLWFFASASIFFVWIASLYFCHRIAQECEQNQFDEVAGNWRTTYLLLVWACGFGFILFILGSYLFIWLDYRQLTNVLSLLHKLGILTTGFYFLHTLWGILKTIRDKDFRVLAIDAEISK